MQKRSLPPSNARKLTDLWLDGASPSESDLRAASSLAARLASFDGMQPFSGVVQSLVDHVSCPDLNLDEARRLIESDPALAARILGVANSAAYRAYGPCASVAQAIVRIGANNVSGLAMAMSAMTLFKDMGGVGQKIRDHSAGTAAVARELAMCLDLAALSSKVFLAGLLHDLGKLLLIQTGDVGYAALVAQELSPSSLHLREQALWGFDHAMLGAHVLLSWNIPAPIPHLIACHHQPKGGHGGASAFAKALDLLRLADVVDWLLGQGCAADSSWVQRLAESPDGARVGLGEETLPSLWDDLQTIREEALLVFK
ncbi:MAG TPA: HDOD domain-containing protein [Polyangia bacterium]